MSKDFIHIEEKGIKYLVHPKGSIFEGMKIRENPDDAFNNAIKRGMKKYAVKGAEYIFSGDSLLVGHAKLKIHFFELDMMQL